MTRLDDFAAAMNDHESAAFERPHGSYVVRQILSIGRPLDVKQLEYLADMANRLGFCVLDPRPDLQPNAFSIRLNIEMEDNVFVALLEEDSL